MCSMYKLATKESKTIRLECLRHLILSYHIFMQSKRFEVDISKMFVAVLEAKLKYEIFIQ